MKFYLEIIFLFFYSGVFSGCVSTSPSEQASRSIDAEFRHSVNESMLKRTIIEFQPKVYVEAKSHAVLSEDEGIKFVDNSQRFLKAVLTQSYEPYLGRPHFNPECLAKNIVQDTAIQKNSYSYEAHLTSERDLKIGQCRRATEEYLALNRVVFCKRQMVVYDITVFSPANQAHFEWAFDCEL